MLGLILSPKSATAYVGLCCAHCGGNMPLNIMGGGIPETHEFRFKISQSFMRMGPYKDGSDDIDPSTLLGANNGTTFAAVPAEMRMYMTMVSAAYSFTDDFAAMVMTSYKRNDMPMLLNGALGGFNMFSEGIGDTKVLGKYRLMADDNLAPTRQISAVFGLSVPTGSIDEGFKNHPNAAFQGRILPFRMQLGSGTFDPILGLTYQGSKDPYWYGANLQYTGRWYDNDQGYHQGQEIALDLYTMMQFHPKAVAHFQLNNKYEGKYSAEPFDQRIKGEGHAGNIPAGQFLSPLFDPHNYGGYKLTATAGIQFQPIPLQIVELDVSIPLYQDLNGPQLADDWKIQATWYWEVPTSKSRRHTGTHAPKELGF
ncbi:MAG: transporter [Candidatus Nitrohelix vancouverensis]|uniref:Transporter n=1 Tax=Candidatus Nitrohelix vancouverensis TaxID=2705534 RepID=A0A7T0G4S5_9BACT|nr:MAG: transporter [Candidatus Nitrohelix vancouverensis]